MYDHRENDDNTLRMTLDRTSTFVKYRLCNKVTEIPLLVAYWCIDS